MPVADGDLKYYFEVVDSMPEGPERDAMRKSLHMWPGCLINTIDFLHEMRVKYKDLKPKNILILGNRVLLADFGISKDVSNVETTTSLTWANLQGTAKYWAPEVEFEKRRGRAVDIFSSSRWPAS
jgi:serine/threonine protein kinase